MTWVSLRVTKSSLKDNRLLAYSSMCVREGKKERKPEMACGLCSHMCHPQGDAPPPKASSTVTSVRKEDRGEYLNAIRVKRGSATRAQHLLPV